MPSLSVRLTDKEYKLVTSKIEHINKDNPPTTAASVMRWLLLKWANSE